MPTDYVLFIHGVSTRRPTYADNLISKIKRTMPINPLVVYWGDVSMQEEEELRAGYVAADIWKQLWFRGLREGQMLQFAGDAALYLSRYIGAEVADKVAGQVEKLKDGTAEDRLHLVTHSMGTVILFDLLFSARWDKEKRVEVRDKVMGMREMIFGVAPNPGQGVRLGSITTMGSPIAIFSLMDVSPPEMDMKSDPRGAASTHDITPSLVQLLEALGKRALPWRNFVHPGDPIASPLEGVLPKMLDEHEEYIDIEDVPVPLAKVFREPISAVFLDRVGWLFNKTPVSILNGANAHSSYWRSPRVIGEVTQLIRQARAPKSVQGKG